MAKLQEHRLKAISERLPYGQVARTQTQSYEWEAALWPSCQNTGSKLWVRGCLMATLQEHRLKAMSERLPYGQVARTQTQSYEWEAALWPSCQNTGSKLWVRGCLMAKLQEHRLKAMRGGGGGLMAKLQEHRLKAMSERLPYGQVARTQTQSYEWEAALWPSCKNTDSKLWVRGCHMAKLQEHRLKAMSERLPYGQVARTQAQSYEWEAALWPSCKNTDSKLWVRGCLMAKLQEHRLKAMSERLPYGQVALHADYHTCLTSAQGAELQQHSINHVR